MEWFFISFFFGFAGNQGSRRYYNEAKGCEESSMLDDPANYRGQRLLHGLERAGRGLMLYVIMTIEDNAGQYESLLSRLMVEGGMNILQDICCNERDFHFFLCAVRMEEMCILMLSGSEGTKDGYECDLYLRI